VELTDHFRIDQFFFQMRLPRYVVAGLKTGKFKPDHLGYAQLGITPANSTSTSRLSMTCSAGTTATKPSAS
jgi:hypothetical protein